MKIGAMTIKDIQRGYMERKFTATEIVKAHLDRIKKSNHLKGFFMTLNEEQALEDAGLIDLQLLKAKKLDSLLGIPLVIKDNICTKGIKTTSGSKILKDFLPSYDAELVKKAKNAGAIILGKTKMREFDIGNSFFDASSDSWNKKKILDDASATVATGLVPIAISTDSGDSIKQAATFYGLVGMKASFGLISKHGLISLSQSLDHIGLISRSVEDCAITLGEIQGAKEKKYIFKVGESIKGIKIGIHKNLISEDLDSDILNYFNDSIAILEQLGANVEEFSMESMGKEAKIAHDIISSVEASYALARYDGIRFGHRTENYKNIDELIVNSRTEGFSKEVKEKIIMGTYILSSDKYKSFYEKATLMKEQIKCEFEKAFENYDILLSPSLSPYQFDFGEIFKDSLAYTLGGDIIGIPSLSIPCNFNTNGYPLGLNLIGRYFSEERLLNVAYHLEQAFQTHKSIPVLEEKNNEI